MQSTGYFATIYRFGVLICGPKNRVFDIKSGHDFCRYRNSIQVIYFQINGLYAPFNTHPAQVIDILAFEDIQIKMSSWSVCRLYRGISSKIVQPISSTITPLRFLYIRIHKKQGNMTCQHDISTCCHGNNVNLSSATYYNFLH